MNLNFNDKTITKKEAEHFAKKLEKIKLGLLIKDLDVEEWKELYNEETGKLLPHMERKRYYKININYEPE